MILWTIRKIDDTISIFPDGVSVCTSTRGRTASSWRWIDRTWFTCIVFYELIRLAGWNNRVANSIVLNVTGNATAWLSLTASWLCVFWTILASICIRIVKLWRSTRSQGLTPRPVRRWVELNQHRLVFTRAGITWEPHVISISTIIQ